MGDGQTDYSSSESMGSDKYFNILSTILEECNEDTTLGDVGSSSDPSDANKTGESDSTDRRSLKGSKTKKKVAFVLPTKKDDDWVQESQYRGDAMEYNKGSSTSAEEDGIEDLESNLKNLHRKILHNDDCSWGKLKTVFDILEMPELSGIFKGFESDCCTNKCQDTKMKTKKEPEKKKKKSSKKSKRNNPKVKENKKDEIHEFKCDHSKLMRNEDGTRIEVDHHFKNSSNPALLNWLDKKNKEEKKKRREERKAKKQERKEKKMQALAQVERKSLSDTLVKDWMKKKKKELRKRFTKRKVEPDGASHTSLDTNRHEAPVGYTMVETFSSEGVSSSSLSSGPPSRIGATDSGLSTTSVTSLHNSFNSTNNPIKTQVIKVEKTMKKAGKYQESMFKSNNLLDDEAKSKHHGNPVSKTDNIKTGTAKVPGHTKTFKKSSGLTSVLKNVQKQSPTTENLHSDAPKHENVMQHKKGRRKRRTKVNPAKQSAREEINISSDDVIKNKNKDDLETEIILKETKRRVEEKLNRKKRVPSWHKKEDKSPQKLNTKRGQYNWISSTNTSDMDLEQTAVSKHMALNQRPEPQGSDDVYTSNESVDEIHKDSSHPVSDISEASDNEGSDHSGVQYSDNFDTDDNSDSSHSSKTEEDQSDDSNSRLNPEPIATNTKTSNQIEQSLDTNIGTGSKSDRNLAQSSLISPSVREDDSHSGKKHSPIKNKTNRDFDDCIDFFLEDYHRPWMEL